MRLLSGPLEGVHPAEAPPDGYLTGACGDVAVGDLNGDGHPDLALASAGDDEGGRRAGAMLVTYGPFPTELESVEPMDKVVGGYAQLLGSDIAILDDLDGDGRDEIAVSAPEDGYPEEGPGAVYVFFGPPTGATSSADADQVLAENDGNDAFGADIANVGDVDGDGLDDLAVSGPNDDEGGAYAGAVWFYSGASLVP